MIISDKFRTWLTSGLTRRRIVAGLGFAACLAFVGEANAQTGSTADMDALIKAARAEGEVTFYGSATENVLGRVVREFNAKYGIKSQFLRLAGTPLLQRYASEAESGNIVADLMISTSDMIAFAEKTAIPKGWAESPAAAKLPAMDQFPKEYSPGGWPLVQLQLWLMAYNNEKLKPGEAPKEWSDMVEPRFKDAFLLPDPGAATTYIEFWWMLHKKYGDAFFRKLVALNPRHFPSGVPASQSLAAGEGTVQAPVTGPQIKALQDKGAPLTVVKPSFTTGIEFSIMLTDHKKARSPNAARLLANWLLTPEGNKVLNADPGVVSVYDKSAMPNEYLPPDSDAALAKSDQIKKLLGF